MDRFESERKKLRMLKSNPDRPEGQETPSVPTHSNGPDESSVKEQSDDVYLPQGEISMIDAEKNDFACIHLRSGERHTRDQWKTVDVIGQIQNISQGRRIREYQYSLAIPKGCLAFPDSMYPSEVPCENPEFREFRLTEKDHNGDPIFPGGSQLVIAVEIRIEPLDKSLRSTCLGQLIKATAIVDEEVLKTAKPVCSFMES
jgi:hypothetical protein